MRGKNQPVFKPYRFCPHCGAKIVADRTTQIRQTVSIFISIITLVLVLFMFRFKALFPYVIALLFCIFVYVYHADKKVKFKQYNKSDSGEDS